MEKSYVPLEKITECHHNGNIYEITNAAIKRSSQLILSGGKSVEACENNIVSASLVEVLGEHVKYKVEDADSDNSSKN